MVVMLPYFMIMLMEVLPKIFATFSVYVGAERMEERKTDLMLCWSSFSSESYISIPFSLHVNDFRCAMVSVQ